MGLQTDPRIGQEVAGYRIEALIGRGGMGAVYRAEDVRLGRKVALKLLVPDLAEDERFRERFLRESRLAASIDHPNIVPIYQAGEADGSLFIAMRYVEGTDLGRLLADVGVFEPRHALTLLEQIAKALDAAHAHDLVHRDVKPGNVLIAGSGDEAHCYLADFGLTKQASSISGLTGTGQMIGTVEYVSPEQIRGEPVDARADVYALACVAYECLTGASPFERSSEVAVLWAHVNEPPPRASAQRPTLPKAVDAVFAKALAKEAADRYATCAEFIRALRDALESAQPRVAPIGRARISRRVAAALAVLALVAAAIVAAVLLTRGGREGLGSVPPRSVGVIDPKTNAIRAAIPVGTTPAAIAIGGGAAWVAGQTQSTITRIDAHTHRIDRTIPLDAFPDDVAFADGNVWVAYGALSAATRIPASGDSPGRVLKLPTIGAPRNLPACSGGTPASLAVGGGVWMYCSGIVARLDRVGEKRLVFVEGSPPWTNNRIGRRVSAGSAIAAGFGGLWVVSFFTNAVSELDPATAEVDARVTVAAGPAAVATGYGAVWAASFAGGAVSRITPARFGGQAASVLTIPVGRQPIDIAVGEGAVWVANAGDRTVSRIDPRTNEVTATIPIGSVPVGIATGAGAVWVTTQREGL